MQQLYRAHPKERTKERKGIKKADGVKERKTVSEKGEILYLRRAENKSVMSYRIKRPAEINI